MGMGSKGNSRNLLVCAGIGSLWSARWIASSSLWASGTMTSWDDVFVSFLRDSLMALIHTAAFFCPHFLTFAREFPFLASENHCLWYSVLTCGCTQSYTGWRYQLLHSSTPNTHHKHWWLKKDFPLNPISASVKTRDLTTKNILGIRGHCWMKGISIWIYFENNWYVLILINNYMQR